MKNLHDDEVRRIEQWLQEAMGMDDASLLKEAAEAERQWELEKELHPEEAEQIEKNADLNLELLMARLDAEGIKPLTEKEYEQNRKREEKRGRKRKRVKRLIVAAAAGMLVVGTMNSVAKSGYRYIANIKPDEGSAILRYNSNISFIDDELDLTYRLILEKLEIPILKLDYVPSGMIFIKGDIDNGHAVLRFDYAGKSIYLKEDKLVEKRAMSVIESDRSTELKIYNDWIEKEIYIEENKLEDGEIEYSANIEGEDACYYFSGVMEKEEFVKVVESLNYY